MLPRKRLLAVLIAGILALLGPMQVQAGPVQAQRQGPTIQNTDRDTAKPRWCKKKKNKNKPACKKDGKDGGDGRNCDSSYPDFCIPPPPPDLDCAQVNGSDFTVVGSDPHGFDGDNDGVGCES